MTLPLTGLNFGNGALATDDVGDVFIGDYSNNGVVEWETRAANFISANVCPAG